MAKLEKEVNNICVEVGGTKARVIVNDKMFMVELEKDLRKLLDKMLS